MKMVQFTKCLCFCTVCNFVLVSLVTTNLLVISHVLNFYWLYIYVKLCLDAVLQAGRDSLVKYAFKTDV